MCGHGQHLAKLKRTDQVHCSTTTVSTENVGYEQPPMYNQ